MDNRISIVIPTYGRDLVLVTTIRSLIGGSAAEIIVVDQTPTHDEATESQLDGWAREGLVQWIRLSQPSIPGAMNVGLQAARHQVVLFLDDDVEPIGDLAAAHAAVHDQHAEAGAVVGQVLQPGEDSAPRTGRGSMRGLQADLDFPFWSDERAWVSNVMAGNLSVKREKALAVGGFDENFLGVAYRFETEFARRFIRAGEKILFDPSASLRHLRAERGGTRSNGSHLASASPLHGMGDYYFALQSGLTWETVLYVLRRPLREVSTKFHLTHPWYVPVKLLGEMRALVVGIRCWRRGPRLMNSNVPEPLVTNGKCSEAVE